MKYHQSHHCDQGLMENSFSYHKFSKYGPFRQTPSSLFSHVNAPCRASSDNAFSELLDSFVIDCICKHVYKKPHSLATAKPSRLLLLKLGTQAYMRLSHVTTTMQVVSIPLSLVSTNVLLISHSTHSEKLPFFRKAPTVDLASIKDCKEQGRYRMHEYLSKRPFPTFASK